MSIIRRRPLEVKPKMESGKNHRFAFSVGRTTSAMFAAHKVGANMLLQAEFPPSYYRGALRMRRKSDVPIKEASQLKPASPVHDAPIFWRDA